MSDLDIRRYCTTKETQNNIPILYLTLGVDTSNIKSEKESLSESVRKIFLLLIPYYYSSVVF